MSSDLIRIDRRHHFVADTHFGHVGILDMAMRPYSDIRAHDRDLVEQWNALVRKGDTVWHLGDFSGEDVPFERAAEIFRKLNGTIRLIRGNHDGDEMCSKLPWTSVDVDLPRKSGEFPMKDEELHDARETIYERV